MKRNKICWLIGMLLFIPIAYGMLATAFIRITSPRVMKKYPARKGIALTFDDGPHPLYTVRLLDLLKEHDIQATFFVVGEKVRAYPDIVRRMKEEGHQIGIHHYKHTSSWLLSPRQLHRQLQDTDAAIKDVIGEHPTLYRPPWGFMNAATLSVSRPYRIIMWSHVFKDWKVHHCQHGLLEGLRNVPDNGSIVLLHDDGTNPGADDDAPAYMIDKLAIYLQESKEKKIEFVPIDTPD